VGLRRDRMGSRPGIFLDKDVLLKAVRRETRTLGGKRPKDNLNVLQLVVAF